MGSEEFKWPTITAKDLILVHTQYLKPMIKGRSSGRMVSSGISDIVNTSVYSEKTCLKKLMMMKMMMMMMMIIIINEKKICRDVASGIDRHPDRTEIHFRLQIQGNRKLIPCSRTF